MSTELRVSSRQTKRTTTQLFVRNTRKINEKYYNLVSNMLSLFAQNEVKGRTRSTTDRERKKKCKTSKTSKDRKGRVQKSQHIQFSLFKIRFYPACLPIFFHDLRQTDQLFHTSSWKRKKAMLTTRSDQQWLAS